MAPLKWAGDQIGAATSVPGSTDWLYFRLYDGWGREVGAKSHHQGSGVSEGKD